MSEELKTVEEKKGPSGLSIAGFIVSFFGCISFVGMILAIIDLCQKNGRKKGLSIAAIIIAGLWIIICCCGGCTTMLSTGGSDGTSTSVESSQKPVSYKKVTARKLIDDLNDNALKAKQTYEGEYLEVTGKLNNIDASGKYISLIPTDDDWGFTNIQCYIKSDADRQAIMDCSVGDILTIKGKCTSVGEVLGYSIDMQ